MERRPNFLERIARLRAQRWSREVLLAALLTIAAAVFIATAMLGRDPSDLDKTPYEAARKQPR